MQLILLELYNRYYINTVLHTRNALVGNLQKSKKYIFKLS